jgi:hypothetical protein
MLAAIAAKNNLALTVTGNPSKNIFTQRNGILRT